MKKALSIIIIASSMLFGCTSTASHSDSVTHAVSNQTHKVSNEYRRGTDGKFHKVHTDYSKPIGDECHTTDGFTENIEVINE